MSTTTTHLIALLQVPYRHRRWFSFHCRFRVLVAFECGMFGYCCVSLLNACLTTRQTGSYRLPHYHSSQHPLFLNMTHCVHRLALGVVVLSDYFFSPPPSLIPFYLPFLSIFLRLSFMCIFRTRSLSSVLGFVSAPRTQSATDVRFILSNANITIIPLDILCQLCVKRTSD